MIEILDLFESYDTKIYLIKYFNFFQFNMKNEILKIYLK